TVLPLTSDIATPQARTASPLRCTVHAPHSATPQPYLVPVMPSSSRRYHINGIVGSPSNENCAPLTVRLTMMSSLPCDWHTSIRRAVPQRSRDLKRGLVSDTPGTPGPRMIRLWPEFLGTGDRTARFEL